MLRREVSTVRASSAVSRHPRKTARCTNNLRAEPLRRIASGGSRRADVTLSITSTIENSRPSCLAMRRGGGVPPGATEKSDETNRCHASEEPHIRGRSRTSSRPAATQGSATAPTTSRCVLHVHSSGSATSSSRQGLSAT